MKVSVAEERQPIVLQKDSLVKSVRRKLRTPVKSVLDGVFRWNFMRGVLRSQAWFDDECRRRFAQLRQELEVEFQRERQRLQELHAERFSQRGEPCPADRCWTADQRIRYVEPAELMPAMASCLQRANVVLDIGCGIMPQNYLRPTVHICCEPFAQYLEVLRQKTRDKTDRIYALVRASWKEALVLFPAGSVDTVFICDVIEHLEKEEGRRLLEKTVPLARKQVVLFTPLGFMPQNHPTGKDAWGLDGGQWQEHKSGWDLGDFDDRWRLVVSEAFHATDNTGKRLEKPFGAFWAIYNNNAMR